MAKCPKCGRDLEESDYIVEKIKIKIPYVMSTGTFGVPISCKYCGAVLGFINA
ncbi:MAG: hypothetical protein ACP5FQ_07245 [Thermoplasmata archaeon]